MKVFVSCVLIAFFFLGTVSTQWYSTIVYSGHECTPGTELTVIAQRTDICVTDRFRTNSQIINCTNGNVMITHFTDSHCQMYSSSSIQVVNPCSSQGSQISCGAFPSELKDGKFTNLFTPDCDGDIMSTNYLAVLTCELETCGPLLNSNLSQSVTCGSSPPPIRNQAAKLLAVNGLLLCLLLVFLQ